MTLSSSGAALIKRADITKVGSGAVIALRLYGLDRARLAAELT